MQHYSVAAKASDKKSFPLTKLATATKQIMGTSQKLVEHNYVLMTCRGSKIAQSF